MPDATPTALRGLKTHYGAVVVGAGHNGLVAAAYLARAGLSVLVLERSAQPGGATVSEEVFPGMDARLSRYSYLVSLLSPKIVADLGISFGAQQRRVASCTPYERDGSHRALVLSNADQRASRESFAALTHEQDWKGYQHLLRLEQTFARKVWPSLLEPLRTRSDWTSELTGELELEGWNTFVEEPLGVALERHIQNDSLRGLIFTDAKVGVLTHPHDPTLLQNRCYILHVIGNTTGEWQVPVGGMGKLVEELSASIVSAGGRIVTSAPVLAIHQGKPHHTVSFRHEDKEQAVNASRVLVSAGPQVFSEIMGNSYQPLASDEGSVCKVNMLVRRLPQLKAAGTSAMDAFTGTFHLDESYVQMQASFDQASGGCVPDRPPCELYCHSLTDDSILGPALRAEGYHTLTLFGLDAPYGLFASNPESHKAEFLKRYLRDLNDVLLEPVEECLASDAEGKPCLEVKSPQDLEQELALNQGNIFHGELSWFFTDDDDERGRWGVETEYERIYRCGASAVRGGGVSGIPGHNAAQCIFEELGI